MTSVTDCTVPSVATFSVTIPATVDETDGVSVQVQLTDGTTNIGSAFSYTKQPVLIMISHLSADYAGASDELVVLFNNTSSDFDLNGYELQYFSAAGGTGGLTTLSSLISQKKPLSPNATVAHVDEVLVRNQDKWLNSPDKYSLCTRTIFTLSARITNITNPPSRINFLHCESCGKCCKS
ncbi:MAG: hypothetical protein IPG53_08835 [Ignavibacteriales bacterium]|nr:hypothetical protein [Ignavibacteriales bacterium]